MLKEALLDLYLKKRVRTESVKVNDILCQINDISVKVYESFGQEMYELESLYSKLGMCDIKNAIWFGFSMGVLTIGDMQDIKKKLPKFYDDIKRLKNDIR